MRVLTRIVCTHICEYVSMYVHTHVENSLLIMPVSHVDTPKIEPYVSANKPNISANKPYHTHVEHSPLDYGGLVRGYIRNRALYFRKKALYFHTKP